MQRDFEFTPDPAHAPGTATARIVAFGGCTFALAQHTTLEIVEHPQAIAVPGGPAHAVGLMAWHGRRIPLIDAAMLLMEAGPDAAESRYALVVAMQFAPGAPIEHGAIALESLPGTLEVDDAAWCELPARWEAFAISCFMHGNSLVPVLATERLFARIDAN